MEVEPSTLRLWSSQKRRSEPLSHAGRALFLALSTFVEVVPTSHSAGQEGRCRFNPINVGAPQKSSYVIGRVHT